MKSKWGFFPIICLSELIMVFVLGLFLSACVTAEEPQSVDLLPTNLVDINTPSPTQTLAAEPENSPEPSPSPFPEPTSIPNVFDFPDPARFGWVPIVGGLKRPVDIASPNDGTGKLMVLEQDGVIRLIDGEALLSEPFLDIRDRVNTSADERGLLGIVFHPGYLDNGYFYLNYSGSRGQTVISRFKVSDDPRRADPASEQILLEVEQPFNNHNGGGLAFGPDGYLYIALGDGGAAGDPVNSGQTLSTLLGTILRIDVSPEVGYQIPRDNPFLNSSEARPEIWLYGLRNPWRFSFDSATGDLYIADVGQDAWEEINFLPAGAPGGVNYGWRYREGAHAYAGNPPQELELVDPIWEYNHAEGLSVTGGYVYRGEELPEWQGIYVYGDFISGVVYGLLREEDGSWISEQLFATNILISSFGLDERGEMVLLDYEGGRVLRLERN